MFLLLKKSIASMQLSSVVSCTLQLYMLWRIRPSVCPSIRPSVHPSHFNMVSKQGNAEVHTVKDLGVTFGDHLQLQFKDHCLDKIEKKHTLCWDK